MSTGGNDGQAWIRFSSRHSIFCSGSVPRTNETLTRVASQNGLSHITYMPLMLTSCSDPSMTASSLLTSTSTVSREGDRVNSLSCGESISPQQWLTSSRRRGSLPSRHK